MAISKEEAGLITQLTKQLETYVASNLQKEVYYEGKNRFKNLRIGIPEKFEGLQIGVSWGEIVVESLNDRINLEGFYTDSSFVNNIFFANNLDLKANLAHRDALIFGTCYLLAQPGAVAFGEPEVLITVENPNQTIGLENPRTGRLEALLQVYYNGGDKVGVLILPNTTIHFRYITSVNSTVLIVPQATGKELTLSEIDRNEHNLGFVPAAKLVNRPRASRTGGQSEITHPIRTQIDEVIRTYTGAASARELFAAPQRYLLNADLSAFKTKDGKPVKTWDAYMGKLLLAGKNSDGSTPVVGQFPASNPEAFISMIKQYAIEISAATGIPINMLGYQNSNPASAEAIEAQQVTLSKRGEDRSKSFGVAWQQIMRYAALLAGESIEGNIRPKWRNPRITVNGSIAGGMTIATLAKEGVLPKNSEVTYELLGLDEARIEKLKKEKQAEQLELVRSAATVLKQNNDTLNALANRGE